MDAEVTALIQAYGAGIAALFATHPRPDRLLEVFEAIASADENPHPMFLRACQTLRAAASKA